VQHYPQRILNIHPSLLPKYPGLHTHEQVLANGDEEHGCTVHFVTEDLDAGPVLQQARLQVFPSTTPEELKARIHLLEHKIYPQAIQSLKKHLIP
jgi:phosphoribosylglycinamide formyltransferase-1